MNYEEILSIVNGIYNTGMEIVLTGRAQSAADIYLSGHALLNELESLLEQARVTAESNAFSDRMWYARTGIPIEDVMRDSSVVSHSTFSNPEMNDLDPRMPTVPYGSIRRPWAPEHSWINIMLTGAIFPATHSAPAMFSHVNNIGFSNTIHGQQVFESIGATWSVAFIDSRRTAATTVHGILSTNRPFPLPPNRENVRLYTEFFAAFP